MYPVIIVCEVIAYVLIIIGCFFYAKEKGWPPWVGSLGLFHMIGVFVLWQLPKRPVSRTT